MAIYIGVPLYHSEVLSVNDQSTNCKVGNLPNYVHVSVSESVHLDSSGVCGPVYVWVGVRPEACLHVLRCVKHGHEIFTPHLPPMVVTGTENLDKKRMVTLIKSYLLSTNLVNPTLFISHDAFFSFFFLFYFIKIIFFLIY